MTVLHRWLFRYFPWRFVVRQLARSYGFVDPAHVLSRLYQFAQPSEIAQPLELLRAGAIFHARGLINTQAIQHNLDWIWPFWVQRQFDPKDDAFLPRAFSLTHVNLTHRNWTAIGLPGLDEFPVVDPTGLVTPFWDSWSIDAWIVDTSGNIFVPAKSAAVEQRLTFDNGQTITTSAAEGELSLRQEAAVIVHEGRPVLRLRLHARAQQGASLVVGIRPCNPEGVSFIHEISANEGGKRLLIEESRELEFGDVPDEIILSEYKQGDAASLLNRKPGPVRTQAVECKVGMASAAGMFRLNARRERELELRVPLRSTASPAAASAEAAWQEALAHSAVLDVPDRRFVFLYDAALRGVVLHSPQEVYPGPYTYRRFWFRDAAFILRALLSAGLLNRVKACLTVFPKHQRRNGYFLSQEGEWDSNGEALWIIGEYLEAANENLDSALRHSLQTGAEWILAKRLSARGKPHDGLLPAGFSAEHLGASDFYYWDDFWAIAGLEAAARIFRREQQFNLAERYAAAAISFRKAVDCSIETTAPYRDGMMVPASPYRRMDAGAIGSLAPGYPLKLWAANDPRLAATVDFLLRRCFLDGAFFQDMIHSGLNAYLTLHVAQVLMRASDERFIAAVDTVAQLSSPTGQWPEAIHPRTKGGCMGDGQHIWACAEWIQVMRNMFIDEEPDRLVLLRGIPRSWLADNNKLSFGPTYTRWGRVSVAVKLHGGEALTVWDGRWYREPPLIQVELAGRRMTAGGGEKEVRMRFDV